MLKIGITGNIATGKTTVSNILKNIGVPVVSCDELVRSYQRPGNILWAKIKHKWGDVYLKEDCELDRQKIAVDMFDRQDFRKQLQEIIHPVIREEVTKIFRVWKSEKIDIAAVEAPLLFEAGWESMFDKIIFTYSSREIQLQRIQQEKKMNLELAEKFIDVQKINQQEKENRADLLLNTELNKEELKRVLIDFISALGMQSVLKL